MARRCSGILGFLLIVILILGGLPATVGASAPGAGTATNATTPVQSELRQGSPFIAAGTFSLSSLASSITGSWGIDNAGQLGDGTVASPSENPTPRVVPGLTGSVAVSGGSNHSLALQQDGTVLAWGVDSQGELGDGTVANPSNAPTPQPVIGVGGVGLLDDIVAVAAGGDFSLALRSDGRIIAWGDDISGELGDGTAGAPLSVATPQLVTGATNVIAIAAGSSHALALRSDGTVLVWGADLFGQLGNGAAGGEPGCSGTCNPTPQVVQVAPSTPLTGVVAIAAGLNHSIVLLDDGTLLGWGRDGSGELGDGTAVASTECQCHPAPQAVLLPPGTTIVAIAAGANHNLALTATGTLLAWGRDSSGQLGDGAAQPLSGCQCHATPQLVPGVSGVTAMAGGFFHSLALLTNGTLITWGADNYGQLGDGTPQAGGCFCHPTPQRVPGVAGVTAISVGANHSLIIAAAPAGTTTAADGKTATYGSASVTLAATVATATGTANGGGVTFTVKDAGNATVGVVVTGAVNASGVASATFAIPPGTAAGGYTVEAAYGGAFSFVASDDPSPATLTIIAAATCATIGTIAAPPSCGSASMVVPVTIANSSNNAALTGGSVTVAITQGATVVGTGSAPVAGADPVAVNVAVPLSGLTVGNATATATYQGDGNFAGSTATPVSFAVPGIAVTVTVPTAQATYGDGSATLTAVVTSANGAPFTGGTVTFVVKRGNQTIATLTSGAVTGASPATVGVTMPLNASHEAHNYTVEATYNGTGCAQSGSGTGTLTIKRRILWVKPQDRTIGLGQPNPPTTPPANCLASATATTACWLQLTNGSSFVYGQSWSALNLAQLRFAYSRSGNGPATEQVGATYRITALGALSSNYDLRYQTGTLTVVP